MDTHTRDNRTEREKEADSRADAFLAQCARDGKISTDEVADLSLSKSTSGDSIPTTIIRFADLVQTVCDSMGLPEAEATRQLLARLQKAKLTVRHVELYLNYPTHTQAQLAKIFGMEERTVGHHLARVRKVYPRFRLDTTKAWGVPDFDKMQSLPLQLPELHDERYSDDNLRVVKF